MTVEKETVEKITFFESRIHEDSVDELSNMLDDFENKIGLFLERAKVGAHGNINGLVMKAVMDTINKHQPGWQAKLVNKFKERRINELNKTVRAIGYILEKNKGE